MLSLTQIIEAPPSEVVRAFTEPEAFAAWFVAEGWHMAGYFGQPG